MQHYTNSVTALNGDRVANATITVTDLSGNTVTIYQDYAGTTPLTSVKTNNNGEFDFYVPAGRYNISASGTGIVGYTVSDEFIGIADSSVSPFIQSGTGAVTRTAQDKMREVISVKDFGAVGDGVTDDTAAIQLAANQASGKLLMFPSGTYKVVNGFDISGDNTTVLGYSATLYYPQTSATYYHCIRVFGNNCHIEGIRITSPSGLVRNDTGFGISVGQVATKTKNVVIQNCIVDGVALAGIWFSNVDRAVVCNNIIVNCLADGIHFADGCFDITIDGNVLQNNGDDNIAIINDTIGSPYVGRAVVSNNAIQGGSSATGNGVALVGVGEAVVSGNNISGTIGAGVATYAWTDTQPTSSLIITGNKITSCGTGGTVFGGCGVALMQSSNVMVSGNHITNLAYNATKLCGGVLATATTRLVISGNTFDDNSCDQVVITTATEALVSGNIFGYGAREGVVMSGSVALAVVKDNTFTATAGTNDININLPSGVVKCYNNSMAKSSAITASASTLSRNETQSYTPTITALSGTITTASGTLTYQQVGKFIYCDLSITITTNGTGAGAINVTLPFTVVGGSLAGRENALTGAQVTGTPSTSNIIIRKYDNTYPAASGASFTLSGLLRIN